MAGAGLQIDISVIVQAAPERVMKAFFDPADLEHWWRAVRSVTVPRPLGVYAIEWSTGDVCDDVLGPLGGAFYGTLMDFRPGEEFFVADAYWSPPNGDAIGPMALAVKCSPHEGAHATHLTVRQSGEDEGVRWQRYFEIAARGWQQALAALKDQLDRESLGNRR